MSKIAKSVKMKVVKGKFEGLEIDNKYSFLANRNIKLLDVGAEVEYEVTFADNYKFKGTYTVTKENISQPSILDHVKEQLEFYFGCNKPVEWTDELYNEYLMSWEGRKAAIEAGFKLHSYFPEYQCAEVL